MITKLSSHKKGALAFYFDNGARLNVTFAPYTYSDNNDLSPLEDVKVYESKTFEAMLTDGPDKLADMFEAKYEVNPIGYLEAKDLPEMIEFVDNFKETK